MWKERTGECIHCQSPPNATPGLELDVLQLVWRPVNNNEPFTFLLCTRSNVAYLLQLDGQVQQTFTIPASSQTTKSESQDIISGTFSFHGTYVYILLESGAVCVFRVASGTYERQFQASETPLFGLVHHPHRNLAATYGRDGYIRCWT